jgi:hypothetical protein
MADLKFFLSLSVPLSVKDIFSAFLGVKRNAFEKVRFETPSLNGKPNASQN